MYSRQRQGSVPLRTKGSARIGPVGGQRRIFRLQRLRRHQIEVVSAGGVGPAAVQEGDGGVVLHAHFAQGPPRRQRRQLLVLSNVRDVRMPDKGHADIIIIRVSAAAPTPQRGDSSGGGSADSRTAAGTCDVRVVDNHRRRQLILHDKERCGGYRRGLFGGRPRTPPAGGTHRTDKSGVGPRMKLQRLGVLHPCGAGDDLRTGMCVCTYAGGRLWRTNGELLFAICVDCPGFKCQLRLGIYFKEKALCVGCVLFVRCCRSVRCLSRWVSLSSPLAIYVSLCSVL